MEHRPKPLFWLAVFLAVAGLTAFGLYRSGLLQRAVKTGSPGAASTASTPPAPGGTVEVFFVSSSAKKSWIDAMVKQFNAAGNRVGRKTIVVKASHGNSGEQLDQLKEGKIKPDLWSPGDESWLELASSHWRAVKQRELFDSSSPLVNIPLVITMWEPMARVLGYPAKQIGWLDIARVAATPGGWAAYGHPEWGKFRWGHAHPDANSGFLAVISEVYAALGKSDGIAPEDLRSPRVTAFLKDFEGAVEHYGLSNSWIDDLMHAKGPGYLSAAVQYENTIIESNGKHGNKPFKLVALYPREGNVWTRHPTAILKEEWVTDEKREAAQQFLDFLLGRGAQESAMELGLRPILRDVRLASPFDEEHGVQVAVDATRAFQVPGEAVLKRIRDLWEEVKVPATLVLVLDRSNSMKGAPMDNAKRGAMEFIRNMKPRDQLLVVLFNHEVTELVPLCAIRECGEKAISLVDGVFAEGNTSLHDVVNQSYRKLRDLQRAQPGRRSSILLLSDGRDTSSRMNRNDFLDTLPSGEDFDVPKVYSIAYGSEADKDLLAEISNRTNARLFTSTPEEISKTYKELSANF
jgi:Ca-activated chloride channel family protein